MLCKRECNPFSGASTERFYFKVTKTQGLDQLRDYLSNVVFDKVLKLQCEHLTVNMRFYNTETMSIDIAANVPYEKKVNKQ